MRKKTHFSTVLKNHQYAKLLMIASARTALLPVMSASPKNVAPLRISGLFRKLFAKNPRPTSKTNALEQSIK